MVRRADAHLTDHPVCKLHPGELRRVPQDGARSLIGYHVACPACGFVNIALPGEQGLQIDEGAMTFSHRLACMRCRASLRVDKGAFFWEEPHVRRRAI
jgi:hypothetical protein